MNPTSAPMFKKLSKIPKIVKFEKDNKPLKNSKFEYNFKIISEDQGKIREKNLIEPSNQQKIHVH